MKRDSLYEFLKVIGIPEEKDEFIKNHRKFIKEMSENPQFKKELAEFNALSNKIRYLIYKILSEKELCTCALAEIFEMSESTITHHLKILEKADLIIGIKKGYFTAYSTKNFLANSLQMKSEM
ncbi:MAG: ArsR/SmtB family transcription factor [Candidatus Helarchaeota archaeon]